MCSGCIGASLSHLWQHEQSEIVHVLQKHPSEDGVHD